MVDVSNAFLFFFLREIGEDRFIFDPRRNPRVRFSARVSISRSRRRALGLAVITPPLFPYATTLTGRIELSRTNRFFRMINRSIFWRNIFIIDRIEVELTKSGLEDFYLFFLAYTARMSRVFSIN